MSKLTFDFNAKIGKMKIMHAVNNGPCVAGNVQRRGNDHTYRAARFPYARNHDASFFAGYGGEHTVDINAIFPDFDADVSSPESYDFAITDLYIKQTVNCGTKVFYRLGSRIEHEIKKYNTRVPKDFQKWAEICEHIIAHYNGGWANGFRYGIEYWEIWNEPDLINADGTSPCWQGTEEEYFKLYTTASKHLKDKFPDIKIGGPASVGDEKFMRRFLKSISEENAPLDFFSYHWYWTEPTDMSAKCTRIRAMVDEFGYKNAETILNEWNYVRGWLDEFVYSIEQIIGMKGAAFSAACMLECQNNPGIDMLMYYDARPGTFNGLFDFYTYRPLKGYYAFYHFADLYELKTQYKSVSDDPDIYSVCACDGDKARIMISYYAEDDNKGAKFIDIEAAGFDLDGAKILITDKDQTDAPYAYSSFKNGKITLRLERNSIVYIEK
ncbi:MAG: hypothetical protein IJX51_06870 [Clostridia bacterium]|nr:hypothetical protein [Clostridia bacterium]